MSSNSDHEADKASQDATPDLAPPIDEIADAAPGAPTPLGEDREPDLSTVDPSLMRKIVLFLAIAVGIAGFVVLVIQFIPSLDSQPSKSRFQNVPPMDGPDLLKAFMPGGRESEMGPPAIDPLAAGIEVTREQNSLDHSLVADSFQAALVLQVRQIITSPVGEQLTSLLEEGLPSELLELFQVDPESIESIVVLVDSLSIQPPPAETETAPAVESEGSGEGESDPGNEESPDSDIPVPPAPMKLAVIVKLVEGIDAAEVATALTRSIPGLWRKEEFGGKPGRINALPLPPPLPTGICIYDDQTLLVSSQVTILEMLAANGNSPLAGRLATVDPRNDVILVATVGILPEGILDGLDDQLLPPLAMLRELPGQLQAASIAIRLTSDEPLLQLELDSPDEAVARTVQNSIRGILPLMEIIVTAQRKQFTDNPVAPPGYVEMMELLETLLRNSEVGRQGLTNVITVSLSEEIIASLMTLPSIIEARDSWTDPDAEGETPEQ